MNVLLLALQMSFDPVENGRLEAMVEAGTIVATVAVLSEQTWCYFFTHLFSLFSSGCLRTVTNQITTYPAGGFGGARGWVAAR